MKTHAHTAKLSLLVACAFLLGFGLAPTRSYAQAGAGTIEGTVKDATGGVVPDATVSVRNVATNIVRSVSTNAEGRYVVPFLDPSEYEITVERAGFAKLVRSGVVLRVGDTATIDVAMQVSSTTQVITISGEAPLLDPEKTESSQTVGQNLVQNLPINGRRWENFVLLTPGVTTDGGFGLVSYRGISGLYNENKVDGADNNQAFFSESRGRTRIAYAYSQDAIQEFQVKTSNYDAEFGQAAGGQVNAVTKSGTNQWHGDVFYYLRHFKFNALDSFAKSQGSSLKPEKLRHQFGAGVGGPIIKDRFFFFGNYDGSRRTFPVGVFPSLNSFFSSSASTCPTQATPAQCSAALGFLQSLQGKFPRVGNQDIYFSKLDYQVNTNNHLSAGLNWHDWRSPNGVFTSPTTSTSVLANGFDGVKDRFLVVNWNSAIRSNLANEFRFQYGKDFEFEAPNFPAPNVSIQNAFSYGEPNFLPRTFFPDERRWQFTDNLSIVRGNHTIKTGFDFNASHEKLENLFQGDGIYTYNSFGVLTGFQNWVLDVFGINTGAGTRRHYSGAFTQVVDPITGTGKDDFWDRTYAGYVQDSWKVRSNLLLNMGLRYEIQTVPQPPKPNTATPLLTLYSSKINIDRNNFGPRISLAWEPKSKTVVRFGYGIYYAKTTNSTFYADRVENGVFQLTFNCSPLTCGPLFPNLIFTPPGPTPVAPFPGALTPQVINTNPPATAQLGRGLSPDFVNPLVHEGELVIERELPGQFTLSASYLLSRGERLPVFIDVNLAAPTTTKTYDITDASGATLKQVTVPFYTTRVDTGTGAILTGFSVLNSWYHALVISVRRRYGHGFELLSNFTLSKAIDTGQAIGTNGTFNGTDVPIDPRNQAQEKALSDLDQRKRFVTSVVWAPPLEHASSAVARKAFNGFKFSGIVTVADGQPVTGQVSGAPFGGPDFGVTGGEISSFGGFTGGRIPQVGRSAFTGPGLRTVDFRVAREFRLRERYGVQALWEAFNLFNHTNFTSVSTTASNFTARGNGACAGHTNDCLTPQSNFLVPNGSGNTLYGARQMQVSLRFNW